MTDYDQAHDDLTLAAVEFAKATQFDLSRVIPTTVKLEKAALNFAAVTLGTVAAKDSNLSKVR